MSEKPGFKKEKNNTSADIRGLVTDKMVSALHEMGFYMIEIKDAFPFVMKLHHKTGLITDCSAETEQSFLFEARRLRDNHIKVLNATSGHSCDNLSDKDSLSQADHNVADKDGVALVSIPSFKDTQEDIDEWNELMKAKEELGL